MNYKYNVREHFMTFETERYLYSALRSLFKNVFKHKKRYVCG